MRYYHGSDYKGKNQVLHPLVWETELSYMDDRAKIELGINDNGEYSITGGKNQFEYARIDKKGIMHIKNIPHIWLNKKIMGLIHVTLNTAYGFSFFMYPQRQMPTVHISRDDDFDGWKTRDDYIVEDENISEILVYPDRTIEGARRIKKKAEYRTTTSQW
jgi:hypothetical protein